MKSRIHAIGWHISSLQVTSRAAWPLWSIEHNAWGNKMRCSRSRGRASGNPNPTWISLSTSKSLNLWACGCAQCTGEREQEGLLEEQESDRGKRDVMKSHGQVLYRRPRPDIRWPLPELRKIDTGKIANLRTKQTLSFTTVTESTLYDIAIGMLQIYHPSLVNKSSRACAI